MIDLIPPPLEVEVRVCYLICFVLLRYNTANIVTMALVVCGTEARMEQAITMLKSAVLFTRVKLDLHIFVDDHLQMLFRNKVSYLTFRLL